MTNTCSQGRRVRTPWIPSLFGGGETGIDASFTTARRRHLDGDAWLDLVPGWLHGPDPLFAALLEAVAWSCRTVPMYGRLVDEPRLSGRLPDPLPPGEGPLRVLDRVREALAARYGATRGPGINLYRDGRDGVAWHGDRGARDRDADAVVAVLSLGSPRPLRFRPRGGGASIEMCPGPGDLLVMGGRCQRMWEHTVPRVRASGPRISLTYRDATTG